MGVNFYDTARVLNIASIDAAKMYIDAAKKAGVDAAKFQSYKAETIASKNSPAYWDLTKEPTTSQYELFKKLDGFNKKDYDAPFCNAVSLLTGFTGCVLAVWSFLRPERDRSGWKLAGGVMACALALLAQLFAVQLETVAGDLETALVQASGAAIAGRILFVITLIFETMAVVSHHFAARDRT